MIGHQQLVGLFIEQVHQHHMKGISRKLPESVAAHIGRLRKIKRRQVMRNLNDRKLRPGIQQLSLYRPGEEVLRANVGGEGEEGHFGVISCTFYLIRFDVRKRVCEVLELTKFTRFTEFNKFK